MNIRSIFEQDRVHALPEGFRVLTRSLLLVAGAVLGTQSPRSVVIGQGMNRFVTRAMLIGSLLAGLTREEVSSGYGRTNSVFDGSRRQDVTSQAGKMMVFLSTALCRLGSSRYSSLRGRHMFEYSWRMGVSSLGLARRRSGNDLIARYLGLEWSSLGFYVLAAVRRGSAYSTEAGLKYFIMGAVSSGIYLFGASLVYGITGSVQFGEISLRRGLMSLDPERSGQRMSVALRGSCMMMVAFLFKLAIAPFHAWSPDVYEGSPSSSSLYFAVVPKLAMVVVLLRLVYGPFSARFDQTQGMRRVGSMMSRSVAALAARGQRRRKRFRAYSAVGHMGYLMLGVSCGTVEGIQSARVYARIYLVMAVSTWVGIMSCLQVKTGSGIQQEVQAKYRTDLNGLHVRNSFLAASLGLSVRSMAGIPPRAGFLPKLWVFMSAMSEGRVLLSLFSVLVSCVGAYYYLRWVKLMYFDGISKGMSVSSEVTEGESKREVMSSEAASGISLDESSSLVLSLCLARRVGRILVPGPMRLRTHRMALTRVLL